MVAIADINDRESLQAWLEETNQPREACVVLAHRAAMREVLKTLTWSAQYEHSALPILRALLVSCVFAKLLVSRGTDTETLLELESAAKNAGAAAAYSASADPVFARYYLAADALLVASGEPNRYGSDTDIDWSGVQEDCVKILDGIELFESAIESSTTTKAKFFLLPPTGLPAHWRFWIDWYERALAGEPQPWRLLKEIALKEDAFWQGSDDEVMARINEIVEDYEDPDLVRIRNQIYQQGAINLGSDAEVAARKRVLGQIEQLLGSLSSPSGAAGIGHNQPPDEFALDDKRISEVRTIVEALREDVSSPTPDLKVVVERASRLSRVTGWAAGKFNLTVDEFCKKIGGAAALGVTAEYFGLIEHSYWTSIARMFQSVKDWLAIALGI